MAVPVVETTATSTGSGTTITVTMPSGIVGGNLLVVGISFAYMRTISGVPSGWTLFRNDTDPSTEHRFATYYKVAGSSEPGSYDWTLSAGTNFNASAIRISGVDGTTPVNATAYDLTTSNKTSPSVPTTVADCLIVRYFSVGRDRTFTEPTSHTKVADTTTAAGCDHSVARITQSTAGDTGTALWTTDSYTDGSIHHVFAIAPTSGGGGIRSPLIRGDLTYPATLVGGRLILA
jgi:hypothetical protein